MLTSARAILAISLASVPTAAPLPSTAQQSTTKQVVSVEAQRKAVIITYQSHTAVARHEYFLWRGNCYIRHQSGDYAPVPRGYCS